MTRLVKVICWLRGHIKGVCSDERGNSWTTHTLFGYIAPCKRCGEIRVWHKFSY